MDEQGYGWIRVLIGEDLKVVRGRWVILVGILAATLLAGCEPTTPPQGAGTPPPSTAPSGPPAGTSTVTMAGSTVQIIGTGTGNTPEFDLPAGEAQMTVATCASSGVIPFVTLYDAKDNKLGLIVDANHTLRALVGGAYYLAVAANPDCVWTIALVPG